jgi:hypothetical protein
VIPKAKILFQASDTVRVEIIFDAVPLIQAAPADRELAIRHAAAQAASQVLRWCAEAQPA